MLYKFTIRSSVVLTLLMLAVMSLQAQKSNFWRKVNEKLTVVNKIDTQYIYHPKLGVTAGAFSTVQQVGFDVRVKFKMLDESTTLTGISKYDLNVKPGVRLGVEVGYGKLVLGYGYEVTSNNKYKKRGFDFNVLGKSWGLHLNYFNIQNQFRSSFTIGVEGDDEYLHDEIIVDDPGTLKSFSLDGYYAFNNKRFFYPAAYKASLVQRRTVGSWMLAGRYSHGKLYNSPEASFDSYNLLDCFTTVQLSLGGGYSCNFVCLHKDPTGLRDKGLRNITFNVTALPVITVVDYLKVLDYEYDNNFDCVGENTSKVLCYPMPNVIGSAAMGVTLDRFFISLQGRYNWFYFRSSNAYNRDHLNAPDYLDDISFRGSFYDWKVKLLFLYKF